jgi:hypothetical protein
MSSWPDYFVNAAAGRPTLPGLGIELDYSCRYTAGFIVFTGANKMAIAIVVLANGMPRLSIIRLLID